MVKFYVPWDGLSKRVAPEYTAASKQLFEEFGDEIVLAKMDMSEKNTRKFGMRYHLQNMPEFKVFQGNPDEYIQYDAEYTEEAFVDFVGKMKKGLMDMKGVRKMVAEDLDEW
mmetsp:Transcript_34249/g.45275  ORF Transcript_34249/g.45275 Transcript_34249/m.45275 type:complete len:112 (+) Transcript_34249:3-338(+)